nr:MAG TPA: hypothetical protein [Caudoviricetes sp.]
MCSVGFLNDYKTVFHCVVNCFKKFVCFVFSGGGAGEACLSF